MLVRRAAFARGSSGVARRPSARLDVRASPPCTPTRPGGVPGMGMMGMGGRGGFGMQGHFNPAFMQGGGGGGGGGQFGQDGPRKRFKMEESG